jgi:DNA (cytosine-5)-methyltransferase 1
VRLHVADLFAGAGGASTGVQLAASSLGVELDLVAVNHWPAAVRTHQANHPTARHMCAAVDAVDPRVAVPGGHLHLLVAGPECTFFSTARGGRPVDDQRRASPWHILRWLELLRVDHVLIENVPEFRAWGPLGANNRPLKSKRGQTFKAFLGAIEALNYRVEFRILNAADFGEATTRKRLFIQAARGRGRITWPEPTHSRRGVETLLRGTRRWRPAREVIDWTIPSESIFARKKPLSQNTLRRIQAGLERFGGGPFVLGQQTGSVERSVEEPLPTVAGRGAISCVEPFLITAGGPEGQGRNPKSIDDPMPTILTENRFGLVQPFIITPGGANLRQPRSVDEPLPTVTCSDRFAVVEPFLVPMYGERPGQEPRTHSLDQPVPTIPATGGGKFGLVEPFVVQVTHGGRERSIDEPLPTVTGGQRGDLGLVEPFIVQLRGTGAEQVDGSARSLDEPLSTVSASGAHHALVEPFLSSYYGHGHNVPVSEPVPTITTKDRFALVIPDGMDIRFRMLQPRELAAAMGFPPEYVFKGTKTETTQMIGNAWSVRKAKSLITAIVVGRGWAPAPLELVEETA